MKTLKEVFDHHFQSVKFSADLAREIYRYHIFMTTMNPEHIQFFGSNLLGVYTVRYVPRDISRFFERVLGVDNALLERDVRKLTTIYQENSISSDILNLTLFYLIHRWYTEPGLDEKLRKQASHDCALIFCYRCTIALTNNYFKYPADPRVAQAAYANLSQKHLIKKLGNWKKLCDYRASRIVEVDSKDRAPRQRYRNLYLFNDDLSITSIIQDSQGRFKSLFSIYYNEFDKVHTEGASIATTAATIMDVDGDTVLRERTKGPEVYVKTIRHVINDPNGFIDVDLITVIADINRNTSFRMIRDTLTWLSHAYHDPRFNAAVDKFLVDVVVQGLYYIEHNIPISRRKDLSYILITLKNLFLSTRSTDAQLLSIREQGEKLIRACHPSISTSLMFPTRSAVILYIILRVLAGSADA